MWSKSCGGLVSLLIDRQPCAQPKGFSIMIASLHARRVQLPPWLYRPTGGFGGQFTPLSSGARLGVQRRQLGRKIVEGPTQIVNMERLVQHHMHVHLFVLFAHIRRQVRRQDHDLAREIPLS